MRPLLFGVLFSVFGSLISPLAFALSSRRDWLGASTLLLSSTTSRMMATSSTTRDVNTIKWGIVGLGDVTQKKSGPPFYKCKGSELVAVMRRTPKAAEEWARANVPGKCKGYDNLDEFLKHSLLDAVYISTRPGTHLEICRKVAAAGKAVYVEKPVGRCAAEAEEMERVCRDAKVPLYTAYISRAYERTGAVRQLLLEGVVGEKVTNVSYKLVGTGGARDMDGELPWRLDAQQSGGGLIMDVGCHVVDRIDYLCGPLVDVKGSAENKAKRQPVEDYVQFDATVGPSDWTTIPAEGAAVTCTWDFSGTQSQEAVDELILAGPKGSLQMAAMNPAGTIEILDAKGTLVRTLDQFTMPEHTAQGLIQAVTDDLRGGDAASNHCLSRSDNAIRTQRVLDTALSSYYGGREVGYWSRPESWPGKQ